MYPEYMSKSTAGCPGRRTIRSAAWPLAAAVKPGRRRNASAKNSATATRSSRGLGRIVVLFILIIIQMKVLELVEWA
jgi:hypothetical protein